MQFLRTLFWVVVAVIAVILATRNWNPVTLNLWSGIQADVKLPVLFAIAFLLGFTPPYILYRATRWRLRRRVELSERTLAEAQGLPYDPSSAPPLPGGVPIAVPPGV